jgi:hypothetical protein
VRFENTIEFSRPKRGISGARILHNHKSRTGGWIFFIGDCEKSLIVVEYSFEQFFE